MYDPSFRREVWSEFLAGLPVLYLLCAIEGHIRELFDSFVIEDVPASVFSLVFRRISGPSGGVSVDFECDPWCLLLVFLQDSVQDRLQRLEGLSLFSDDVLWLFGLDNELEGILFGVFRCYDRSLDLESQ